MTHCFVSFYYIHPFFVVSFLPSFFSTEPNPQSLNHTDAARQSNVSHAYEAKQMCQTSAAAAIKHFINLYGIAAPALPFGATLHFAVCHTACSSYGIRHVSSCVLHATSFISSFVPLHYTTFVAHPFATRHGTPP